MLQMIQTHMHHQITTLQMATMDAAESGPLYNIIKWSVLINRHVYSNCSFDQMLGILMITLYIYVTFLTCEIFYKLEYRNIINTQKKYYYSEHIITGTILFFNIGTILNWTKSYTYFWLVHFFLQIYRRHYFSMVDMYMNYCLYILICI